MTASGRWFRRLCVFANSRVVPRGGLALASWVFLAAMPPAAQAQCWSQTAKLLASDGSKDDRFGRSVSISGDWAVVGALDDDIGAHFNIKEDVGSAYVFTRKPNGWKEIAKLTASDWKERNYFGTSVSISGDTLIVGAKYHNHQGCSSAAYVFERNQGGQNAWGETRELFGSDCTSYFQYFGAAVAIAGDTAVVGAPWDDLVSGTGKTEGSVFVFERDLGGSNAWGEVRKLVASDASDDAFFGSAVAISGDTIVVGAYGADLAAGPDEGAAYVFERDLGGPNAWGEARKLIASDAAMDDRFGYSVAISGDSILVGASRDDHAGGLDAGSAYVFGRNHGGPGAWGEIRKLVSSNAADGDAFGSSVSISGSRAVIGAYGDDHANGVTRGTAFVFEADRGGLGAWGEVAKLIAKDAGSNDLFGYSVAVSGDSALVGAYWEDQNGKNSGSAYLFDDLSKSVPYCTAGTSSSGCQAYLASCGLPSASASSGFVLSTASIEGGQDGFFFFGVNGRQASPWGNGTSFQCVVPPVQRAGLLAGVGTPGACDGAFAQDLNARWCPTCPKPSHNPGAGATVHAQLWFLDPLSTASQPSSLSNAVELQVGP